MVSSYAAIENEYKYSHDDSPVEISHHVNSSTHTQGVYTMCIPRGCILYRTDFYWISQFFSVPTCLFVYLLQRMRDLGRVVVNWFFKWILAISPKFKILNWFILFENLFYRFGWAEGVNFLKHESWLIENLMCIEGIPSVCDYSFTQ